MKTIEEAAKELLDDISEYLNIQDYINEPEIEFISKYFRDFETEVRKDQDTMTRHDCFESVLNIRTHALGNVGAVLAYKEVEVAIIGTNVGKEENPKQEYPKEKILNTSNIEKIKWDETNLWVYFNNGGVYQYLDIPEKVSVELGEAESPGSYMHQEIKGVYRYTRIE